MRLSAVRLLLAATVLSIAACSPPHPDEQEAATARAQAAAAQAAAPDPASSPVPPPAGHCEAAAVQGLVGQVLGEDDDALAGQARQDAGASRVRVLHPGQPVTLEFDGDRLNIEVDAQRRIVSLRCG
ncbi:I78 family peptidase inhibitor [Xanthomonas massiliensis]|uniref:I78 family peptidase inhibitor n=1 Tax=Xanthomonas massiliensis TaxID=1720302 RepID=UPI000824E3E8|nr:I78 family peptidase inhibitor [Xanthomonas massiliensis]